MSKGTVLIEKMRGFLLDLLFPPRCVGCGRKGIWLCARCASEIELIRPPICTLCGRPVAEDGLCFFCRSDPPPIDGMRSVAYFEGVMRKAIHSFKYKNLQALAIPLGEMMGDYWRRTPLPTDVIVPVPLHPHRLRERGYNQAALLAKELGKRIGLPVVGSLVRVRETAPQVGLSARERQENVKEAFRCLDDSLVGRRVLLVDDVCTTGATLAACSVALRGGSARSVWALTLARPR
ncbi:MAG: ComF family protein [Chloroflexota bacterium]|nr:ComF family protein [Chloroflexota bacterium]